MCDVHFARRRQARKARVAAARFGLAGLLFFSMRLDPARALFKQIGRHFRFRIFFTQPATPSGRNKVTRMNSAPST